MNLAVLSWGDIQTDLVLFLQHDAVAADILDTGFGIAGNHQMSRAEIAPTVTRMPTRHGKFHEIDIIAAFDVFEYRTTGYDVCFDRLHRP